MTPERWLEIQKHLDVLLDMSASDKRTYLLKIGQQDPEMHDELKSLLAEEEEDRVEHIFDAVTPPPAEPIAQYNPGEKVGGYVLLRQIGRGGMGEVWLAERQTADFHQRVALKLIRKGMDSEDILTRFRTERQILAQLNHPNIARLLDGGATESGMPFFVMEYIEGVPFLQYCDDHRLTIEERLRLFREVCSAVQFAHQNLVVHRDLKPTNILVTPNRQVKLLDFGIAKVLNPDQLAVESLHTVPELRILTPAYASPEQIKGLSLTTASDVYSLGVLLFELLTGSRPFPIATRVQAELIRVVLEEEPNKPSTAIQEIREVYIGQGNTRTLDPKTISTTRSISQTQLIRKLRGDVDNIVLKSLRKEPERRYESAGQLSEDIGRYLEGKPVLALPDTFSYRVTKFIRRNKWAVGGAAAFLVLLLAFSVVMTWQNNRIREALNLAEKERDKAKEVGVFLTDLFKASDPTKYPEGEIPVRAILKQGTNRLKTELNNQPELRAEVLTVLADVYNGMGEFNTSDSLAQTAIRQFQSLNSVSEAYIDALKINGDTNFRMGRLDKAITSYETAYQIHQSHHPVPNKQTASLLNGLSIFAGEKGQTDRALSLIQKVVSIRRSLQDTTEAQNFASNLNTLGNFLHDKKRYNEAEAAYVESLGILKRSVGPEHPYVAFQLNSLATLKSDQQAFSASIQYFKEAERIATKRLPPGHPFVGYLWHNMATAYTKNKQYTQALQAVEKAISIRKATKPIVAKDLQESEVLLAEIKEKY
ncbi:MAG: serine/threonine protein kinase [Bacteroidetes Order II. Incertae sedis bacterium]|nr:serine/threonine protein kinase [Bacteroidetes Order II. bacterium]